MHDSLSDELKTKEIKSISRDIKPITERMLWAVSAGICEFRGCCRVLYRHHVTGENICQAEKAHIYAFSKGGKRPSILRFTQKINDISNLMLVCEGCHKLIDSEDTDYTAEQLIDMKKEHEERILNLVTIKPNLKSEIIIYNANIANVKVKISDFVAKSAIIPAHYPESVNPIRLSPNLSLYDNEEDYWSIMSRDLQREWIKYESAITDKHISLFAVAPQPLLFKLGTLINRNYSVDVRQSQGSIDNWKWICSKQTINVKTEIMPKIKDDDVILTFEITARLSETELRNEFGNGTIYRITLDNCNPGAIKSLKDLNAIIEQYRIVLNNIRESHDQSIKIKLVPIAPVSVSIEAGRQLMKGDPTITIYDRHYLTKKWKAAITINGGNN